MTVASKSTTWRGTNENGERNDATLRQEDTVHEFDRTELYMPICGGVDLFMNAVVARAYAKPKITDSNSVTVLGQLNLGAI